MKAENILKVNQNREQEVVDNNPEKIDVGDFVIAQTDINKKGERVVSRGEVYEVQKINEAGFVLLIGDSGKSRWVNIAWGLSKMDNFAEMFA